MGRFLRRLDLIWGTLIKKSWSDSFIYLTTSFKYIISFALL